MPWLNVNSTNIDSYCGGTNLAKALDGTDYWYHTVNEIHWFVLDLGQTYTIKKVKAMSRRTDDPIDVNIYIDDSNPPTTLCEEGISTWQDTQDYVEITLTTEGTGRYIKVEVEDTENALDHLMFGQIGGMTIFDAYGFLAPTRSEADRNLSPYR